MFLLLHSLSHSYSHSFPFARIRTHTHTHIKQTRSFSLFHSFHSTSFASYLLANTSSVFVCVYVCVCVIYQCLAQNTTASNIHAVRIERARIIPYTLLHSAFARSTLFVVVVLLLVFFVLFSVFLSNQQPLAPINCLALS